MKMLTLVLICSCYNFGFGFSVILSRKLFGPNKMIRYDLILSSSWIISRLWEKLSDQQEFVQLITNNFYLKISLGVNVSIC